MDERRLWAAGIFPWGTEIFGGMWDTDRLHRTPTEAIRDIEDHSIKMGLLPISWSFFQCKRHQIYSLPLEPVLPRQDTSFHITPRPIGDVQAASQATPLLL